MPQRTKGADSDPWDPFWEYVLGDEEAEGKRKGRQSQQATEDATFMNAWLPADEDFFEGPKNTNKSVSSTNTRQTVNTKGKRGFWRRKSKEEDTWSFAETFDSFIVDSDDEAEPSPNKGFWRRRVSRSSNERETSGDKSPTNSSFGSFMDSNQKENGSRRRPYNRQRSSASSDAKKGSTSGKSLSLGRGTKTTTQSTIPTKSRSTKRASTTSTTKANGETREAKNSSRDRGGVGERRDVRTGPGTRTQSSGSLFDNIAATLDPWIGVSASDEEEESSFSSYDESTQASLMRSDEETTVSVATDEDLSTVDSPPILPPRKVEEVRIKYDPTSTEGSYLLPGLREEVVDEYYQDQDSDDEKSDIQQNTSMPSITTKTDESIRNELDNSSVSIMPAPVFATFPVEPPAVQRVASVNRFDPRADVTVPRHGFARIMCRPKSPPAPEELTSDDLSHMFPKLRMVSDHNTSNVGSEILGNSHSFSTDFPAHLQAPAQPTASPSGPQSLYEYEFETGAHMNVVYSNYSDDPRADLRLCTYETPPLRIEKDDLVFNKVVVQVEVRCLWPPMTSWPLLTLLTCFAQASTISLTDCLIRRGQWQGESSSFLPNTPGVDYVGRIYRIDKESSKKLKVRVGDRVLSLTKWGGNTRFLTVNPSHLVKVNEKLDPAEVVCLAETYLSAFQMIHLGSSPNQRYRSQSLKGKCILVLGTLTSTLGRALIQLSMHCGVRSLYCTARPKHFEQLESLGVIPLSRDPNDWLSKLHETVDVVISMQDEIKAQYRRVLKRGGTYVVLNNGLGTIDRNEERKSVASKLICSKPAAYEQTTTHIYDVFSAWDRDIKLCKKDLEYLLNLLENRSITPHILDRVPLSKVARAHEIVESKRLTGFLVCEPWLLCKARAVQL